MENLQQFTNKSVPISFVAKKTGKGEQFIREAIKRGLFNFGKALKLKNRTNYYISAKLLYEETGIIYEEENNA